MNLECFEKDQKHCAPNGFCLNPEERMQVGIALFALRGEMELEEAYFWGKIEGKYQLN